MATIEPNIKNMINDENAPRHFAPLSATSTTLPVTFLYLSCSKVSLAKALTTAIACKLSSTTVLLSATWSWVFRESLRIKPPKLTAAKAITGTKASIKPVSLGEININITTPPVITITCRINCAKVTVKVSCKS